MIAVAIINMTAALLVIILEKTQMIGILKSLGASNWSVRKIFIYNGGYLILVGLLIGNALGLSLIFIQSNFELITLNEENTYSIMLYDIVFLWSVAMLAQVVVRGPRSKVQDASCRAASCLTLCDA